MIVLIPLGGKGVRFRNDYSEPKALIPVMGKPIIYWLLDSISIESSETDLEFIYIPFNKEYESYNLQERLISDYPHFNFKFLKLDKDTSGAAETIRIALHELVEQKHNDTPILCLDADNFYTVNILQKWDRQNSVFTFVDDNDKPIYSYVTTNNNGNILNIVEKEHISDNACTGAYGFSSYIQLYKYASLVINNDIRQKGEYYTSTVIKEMLKDGLKFKQEHICNKDYFSLGTPNQVEEYKTTLLFDLDGTLVNTDDIYVKVWNNILNKYSITVDTTFFNHFIKGRSDTIFMTYLIPNITNKEIKDISRQKDEQFIDILANGDHNILIDGVMKFIRKNTNRKMAIVTSCNKITAEFIMKLTGLEDYINVLIAADDCVNHKPHPDPYLLAMKKLNVNNQNCIIFEDSLSGYLSAKNSNVAKICLICNSNSQPEIKEAEAIKFINYTDPILENICAKQYTSETHNYIILINNALSHLPIKNIVQNDTNLKSGYICDIKSYAIVYQDNSTENIIFKINNYDNELSKTAVKLDMYNKEIYFYKVLSKHIYSLHIPKCYGIIENDRDKGILLEDLKRYSGSFNIDLNRNITCLLRVVNDVQKMHSAYYFKNKECVIYCMKDLLTINNINYYDELIKTRYERFYEKNKILLSTTNIKHLNLIYNNFNKILDKLSQYPLNFCHGDVKSPNIFYKDNCIPYFLDWQYIHLNKGISDIIFLLVESISFNSRTVNIVEQYYYQLLLETKIQYTIDEYLFDLKCALCAFPFFVCVWFNSEDSDKLLDKVFPVRFMKNLLLYYDYYLDDKFFNML